ncbi:MFS transporter [Paracidobacterium acidisoli]|uniref:MFS transporter n=1 Tax=Paracidobacterium acidisoli TaxID=2303751 RepID=A0A372IKI1_9BACT|nr:MFS transporter [Paracidobacterium acidisoli]MBT9332744.1 MFS transporter [Paracidobacterium acidisoli]
MPPFADEQLAEADAASTYGENILRRVFFRLVPFLFLLYVFAYLDRVNIGYAALSIRRDLHFSDTVYGAGAGLFFLGYALFEIPANLVLLRLGPRRWIALIMMFWGVLSSCMSLVHTPMGFYLVRFFLGAAEAGFFPGIVLYLTWWFPPLHRARAVAWFMAATTVAGIVGAPFSTVLLSLHGVAGIAGWKWLFLGEGLPSIVFGILVLFVLVDHPRDARWLAEEERAWLTAAVASHETGNAHDGHHLRHAFSSGIVWLLSFFYFAISVGLYGLSLWLPVMLKRLAHVSDERAIALSAIPYVFAMAAMLLMARSSDRSGERRRHLAASLAVAAVGFALSAVLTSPLPSALALILAAAGIWGCFGPFWALPANRLRGTAAAGGIALINSIGALGGFCGPYLMGRVSDLTHSFRAALWVTAILLFFSALLALVLLRGSAKPAHEA